MNPRSFTSRSLLIYCERQSANAREIMEGLAMYGNHHLNVQLSQLRNLWDQCAETKSRFEFYKYLEEVYCLYADLRTHKSARWIVEQIVQQFDQKPKYQNHPIRLILDATCK